MGSINEKLQLCLLALLLITCFLFIINQKNSSIIENDSSKIEEKIKNKVQGIYVYGFPECPWCQDLYPILDNVLKDNKQQAYLVDTHSKKFSENNRLFLENYIIRTTPFDELIVPLIIMIGKNGVVQYHVGTVEGYDANQSEINENQKQQLYDELLTMINLYI